VPTSSPLRKIGIALLLVLAVGILWFGASKTAAPPDAKLIDAAVQVLDPPSGSPSVPRQQPISVVLVPGWTGVLVVNGIEIPEDQLLFDAGQPNQFSFQPGAGKVIEQLPPGTVVARAVIWRVLETRETGAHSFTWTFRVS
jgi:hypothetical protein